MVDTLFPSAGQLLSHVGDQQQTQEQVGPQAQGINAGEKASSEINANKRQQMTGDQAKQLEEIKGKISKAKNMVTITPQIALGMMQNFPDKESKLEWLKLSGPGADGEPQEMPAPVLMSYLKLGLEKMHAQKSPKVTPTYNKDGTVGHSLTWLDSYGKPQQFKLDEGMAEKLLHPAKPAAGGKGTDPTKMTASERQKFIANYNRMASSVRSDQNALVTDKNNTELQANIKKNQAWLDDNRPDYTQMIQAQKQSGMGGEAPGGVAPAPSETGAPAPTSSSTGGNTLDDIWNAATK